MSIKSHVSAVRLSQRGASMSKSTSDTPSALCDGSMSDTLDRRDCTLDAFGDAQQSSPVEAPVGAVGLEAEGRSQVALVPVESESLHSEWFDVQPDLSEPVGSGSKGTGNNGY